MMPSTRQNLYLLLIFEALDGNEFRIFKKPDTVLRTDLLDEKGLTGPFIYCQGQVTADEKKICLEHF